MGIYSIVPPEGMTRNCIDAWAMAFVRADGGVAICCYSESVGNLKDGNLEEILNSDLAIAYRNGLLTGQLLPKCKNCPDKRVVSISVLENRVSRFLDHGDWGSDGTSG